jgi:hypothetical protein
MNGRYALISVMIILKVVGFLLKSELVPLMKPSLGLHKWIHDHAPFDFAAALPIQIVAITAIIVTTTA